LTNPTLCYGYYAGSLCSIQNTSLRICLNENHPKSVDKSNIYVKTVISEKGRRIGLKSNANILEKHEQQAKLDKIDTYAHLSNDELLENLRHLIKKANSTKGLNPKLAREILLEDRR
jgi:hypothetical protein